jgi:hypothetical protein
VRAAIQAVVVPGHVRASVHRQASAEVDEEAAEIAVLVIEVVPGHRSERDDGVVGAPPRPHHEIAGVREGSIERQVGQAFALDRRVEAEEGECELWIHSERAVAPHFIEDQRRAARQVRVAVPRRKDPEQDQVIFQVDRDLAMGVANAQVGHVGPKPVHEVIAELGEPRSLRGESIDSCSGRDGLGHPRDARGVRTAVAPAQVLSSIRADFPRHVEKPFPVPQRAVQLGLVLARAVAEGQRRDDERSCREMRVTGDEIVVRLG